MTKQDQQEFKKLIKEGTLEVLESKFGQEAIKKGALEALRSKEGNMAIVEALGSVEGQEVLIDSHAEYFHDVIAPEFEDIPKNFNSLKGDVIKLKADVSYLKDVAIRREEVNEMIKKSLKKRIGAST